MPRYVDGFVIPVKRSQLKRYLAQARIGARVWKEHGALAYVEAVGDDLAATFCKGFPKMAGARAGETVIFSFIVYRSRAHRDRVNRAVMKDPRLAAAMEGLMPFDPKRMAMGGFRELIGW